MSERTTRGRLVIGTIGMFAAVAGFVIAVSPVLAGGVAAQATTDTGTTTGTTAGPTKVVLCHKAKVTIKVSSNAEPAHRRHGDTVGACTHEQLKKAKAKADKVKDDHGDDDGKSKGAGNNGNGKAKGKATSSSGAST